MKPLLILTKPNNLFPCQEMFRSSVLYEADSGINALPSQRNRQIAFQLIMPEKVKKLKRLNKKTIVHFGYAALT
jgi:hypothetical protein